MSGGHGHDGHDDGPGHSAAHGHDAPAAGHGSGEIPPAPATREISPARGEYTQPWPGALLLWPVVWVGVGALFFFAARAGTGPVKQHHEAGASPHGVPAEHGAPAEPGAPEGHR